MYSEDTLVINLSFVSLPVTIDVISISELL